MIERFSLTLQCKCFFFEEINVDDGFIVEELKIKKLSRMLPMPNIQKEVLKSSKKNLTPNEAISLLANDGITVSKEEAEKIIEFIYSLAEIAIRQVLKPNEPNDI
jgi:hypothetical protein